MLAGRRRVPREGARRAAHGKGGARACDADECVGRNPTERGKAGVKKSLPASGEKKHPARRWVVERTFGWLSRCGGIVRDDERLPQTLAGYHWLVFAILMLAKAGAWLAGFAQAVNAGS